MTALRILLVDDEKALLALLKRHLERAGHSVVDALSSELARSALTAADGWQPDILIADETLPGDPGSQLPGELLTRFPAMLCRLCSGYPLSLEALPAAVRARAAILQKPYMPAALERTVAELVGSAPR